MPVTSCSVCDSTACDGCKYKGDRRHYLNAFFDDYGTGDNSETTRAARFRIAKEIETYKKGK